MSKQYYFFDELHPEDALAILADTAEKSVGKYFEELRLQISTGIFGNLAIVFPDVYSERGEREDLEARKLFFKALKDAYSRVKNSSPRIGSLDEDSFPLHKGLVWLLLACKRIPTGQTEDDVKKEYLVIGRNLNSERIAAVFEDLKFHATSVRMAARQGSDGHLHLFRVLDDQERHSSFPSAVAGDLFSDCNILGCLRCNRQRIFLPMEIIPATTGINYFFRILTKIPGLYSQVPARDGQEYKLAIDLLSSDHSIKEPLQLNFELINLTGIPFTEPPEFTAPLAASASDIPHTVKIEIHDLHKSKDVLYKLKSAFERQKAEVGYHLHLNSTQHLEATEIERERIQEKIINLQYQLAYLDSASQPRPVLLRFTQKQLRALADVIRSYPQKIIRDGNLHYAFQATNHQPKGLHYLLIDPQKAHSGELDPLLMWSDPDGPAMRFRLDPFWARYYHGPNTNSLVYVPEGRALSPPMHSWDAKSMDDYLRESMGRWHHDTVGKVNIPDRPIYIFDNTIDSEKEIDIYVLDQDSFQPLRTRLGFLNDNLAILQAVDNKAELFEQMAQDIRGSKLAKFFEEKRAEVEAAFKDAAQKTACDIAEKVNVVSSILKEEIQELIQKYTSTTEEFCEMQKKLSGFTKISLEMAAKSKQVETLKDDTEKKADKLIHEIDRLENQVVKPALEKAEKTRARIAQKVSAEIDALRNTVKNLQNKIHRLN